MMKLVMAAAAAAMALSAVPAAAQQADISSFKTGPVFSDFGAHAPVEGIGQFADDTEFSIVFDVASPAIDGGRNRGFESTARFINMHVAHGVTKANIRLVVVVHGKAVMDLLRDGAWAAKGMADNGQATNGSGAMVRSLLDHKVRFIVCGQSAAAYGVTRADLIPGVEMALSAMTAHAELQKAGYTVNPF